MKSSGPGVKSCFVVALMVCALNAALVLADGGDDGKVKHVEARAAAVLVATNGVLVLDVRTPGEFARGHIAGATNINFLADDFSERVGKLDRGKRYLVHCATGGRSTRALPRFKELGFTNVFHLDGGFKGWQAAGNPVQLK